MEGLAPGAPNIGGQNGRSFVSVCRYVEGGKYIETHTGCGSVWGQVDADASFSFRGIPYSAQVQYSTRYMPYPDP